MNTSNDRRLAISRAEAAVRLGISLNSFERHVQPYVRTIRVGRRVLVPIASLEDYLYGEARASGLSMDEALEELFPQGMFADGGT